MDASQIAKAANPQLKQILLYLYGYQTPEEQSIEHTVEDNGVGFNGIDSEILSSFAKQVIAQRELSEKQYNILRLRLPKYYRQLNGAGWEEIVVPEVIYTNGGKKDYSQVRVAFETRGGLPEGGELTHRDFAMSDRPKNRIAEGYTGLLTIDPDNGGLMFKPNTYPSKQIQKIGFGSWKGGYWHQHTPKVFPEIVKSVKEMFGNILVDPSVDEALAPKPLPELPNWLDAYPTLHGYQKEAIQFTSSHQRLLLALAPRLGKTVVTVLSADIVQAKKILVVAPLSLLKDWKNKILKWSRYKPEVAIVYKKNLPVPARWTITNYDTLRLHRETFHTQGYDLIIVDESILVKNRKAKRTEAVKELTYAVKPHYMWLLSGAPTSRLYTDLWAQLNILDPKQFSGYWRFAENYCINQPNEWTKYNIVANKPNAAEEIKKDLAHIYYPRSAEDVTDMPALEPENLGVAMGSYQDKMYGQMEYEFLAELPDDERLLAPNVLAQLTRLIQIASNPLLIGGKDESSKWDALMEMLYYEAKPIIVWTSFIETVHQIRTRLAMKEIRLADLTGATKQDKRAEIVEAFQGGGLDLILAHPAVGKYGLDLYNAKSVIYLERGHNADDYYQSLNRVRHVEQKEAPHIVHLLAERKDGAESIDHVVDQILQSRTDATKKLSSAGLKKLMTGEVK